MTTAVLTDLVSTLVFLALVFAAGMAVRKLVVRATGARGADGRAIAAEGGWDVLAARFTDRDPAPEPLAHAATVMVGATVWKNCVTVGVDDVGLHLAVKVPLLGGMGRPPLLVPWEEIVEVVPARLHWGLARRLVIGRPTLATLTLPEKVYEKILARGRLAA